MRIFETSYYNEIQSLSINSTGIQSFLSILDYYLVGDYDGYLYLIDLKNNLISSKIPAHKGAIYSILKINDQYFATCSRDKTIKIWCIETMNVIQKLELKTGGHKNSVNRLILFGEKLLVSCSDDSRIIVWKICETETTVIL
jgi:WD40 repeat protein